MADSLPPLDTGAGMVALAAHVPALATVGLRAPFAAGALAMLSAVVMAVRLSRQEARDTATSAAPERQAEVQREARLSWGA